MARDSQEVGFTQPRAHLLADPCTDPTSRRNPLGVRNASQNQLPRAGANAVCFEGHGDNFTAFTVPTVDTRLRHVGNQRQAVKMEMECD